MCFIRIMSVFPKCCSIWADFVNGEWCSGFWGLMAVFQAAFQEPNGMKSSCFLPRHLRVSCQDRTTKRLQLCLKVVVLYRNIAVFPVGIVPWKVVVFYRDCCVSCRDSVTKAGVFYRDISAFPAGKVPWKANVFYQGITACPARKVSWKLFSKTSQCSQCSHCLPGFFHQKWVFWTKTGSFLNHN